MNLNDKVQFRLTEDGKAAIHSHFRQFDPAIGLDWFKHNKPDNDGWYTEQLWSLMQMLGPSVCMGGPQHIVGNEIRPCEPDMEPAEKAGREIAAASSNTKRAALLR